MGASARTSTEQAREVQGEFALGEFRGEQGDKLPQARALAVEPDLNHAPEPGGLQEIGTCRACGFIIAEDEQGEWHHQPSVAVVDAGQTRLDRNLNAGEFRPGDGRIPPGPSWSDKETALATAPIQPEESFLPRESTFMVKEQSKNRVGFVYLILGAVAAIGITMGLFFSIHPVWVGEQSGNADYVHRTLGLLSDLPHMTVELFYDAIENSVVFCIAFLIARRALRKEHELFDTQHGISHED
jgi:hypothetical protein